MKLLCFFWNRVLIH